MAAGASAAPPPAASPTALANTSLAPPVPKTAHEPEQPKSNRRPIIALLAVAGLATAVALGLATRRGPEPTAVHKPLEPTVTKAALPEVPKQAALSAEPDSRIAVAAEIVPEKTVEKSASPGPRNKPAARDETLPGSVSAELDAAEKALAAKDPAEAIRRARHSLYEKKSSRASSILTRAFCLQGDLGAAKAELAHLAGAERARAIRACRAAGIDL